MFTGIVKEKGKILSIKKNKEGIELIVSSSTLLTEIAIDDSVAINGVCQTVTKVNKNSFTVQAVHTTLEKTTFGFFKTGDSVNLELALRPIDRLGGHFVSGHVNGLTKIISIQNTGKNYQVTFEILNESDMKYLIKEGSITLDGVSLTISDLFQYEKKFKVSLIPHTWDNTVFSEKKIGDFINYEVDILGKYVENLLFYSKSPKNLTQDWLKEKGF